MGTDIFARFQRDWKHSSSTLSLEEVSDLQAVFREAFTSRLSSTEGIRMH